MASLIRVDPADATHRVIVGGKPACTCNGTARVYAGKKRININNGDPNRRNVYAG